MTLNFRIPAKKVVTYAGPEFLGCCGSARPVISCFKRPGWHQYSAVAAAGDTLPLPVFDALQRVYRMWLADGWTAIDGPYPTHDQAKLRTMGLTS